MHKVYIILLALCLHFLAIGMANDKKDPHKDLLNTIAALKKRGEHAQKDSSKKEERLRIKAKHKRAKIKKENLKKKLAQAIKQKFPSAPTPNDLEELQKIYAILFSKDVKNNLKSEKQQ